LLGLELQEGRCSLGRHWPSFEAYELPAGRVKFGMGVTAPASLDAGKAVNHQYVFPAFAFLARTVLHVPDQADPQGAPARAVVVR
jgi:hypothetical protein